MVKMESLRTHNYGGKAQKPGAVYKATERHAKVLRAVGKAKYYVEPAPAPAPEPEKPAPAPRRRTRATTPRSSTPTTSSSNTYQTRQLKAEDE